MTREKGDEVAQVTPTEAYEILSRDKSAVLVDVRSRVEYEYVGHPPDAVNVPWKDAPSWQVDPEFAAKVRDRLAGASGADKPPESLTVLTLCRSGGRSQSAAENLKAHGFRKVMNVAEGFEGDLDDERHRGNINGWRFHGLPWEQT